MDILWVLKVQHDDIDISRKVHSDNMKNPRQIIPRKDLKSIEEWSSVTGKKLLFYHNDPDGICSAALWMECFDGFELVAREGPVMKPAFVRWIADQDPDVLVFLDLPVDQEWNKIRWLEEHDPELKVVVIDHHIPDRDISSGQTVHINNRFIPGLKDKYVPASYLIYRILEGMGKDVRPLKWLAGAGIIGDYGQKDCRTFFRGIKGKMNVMKNVSDLISAAVTLKGRQGAERVLKILLRERDAKGFLGRKTLALWKGFVDREVKATIDEYRKGKEDFPELGLAMFRVKSRLNIVSVVSTLLSAKHPHKIIVIYKLSRKGMWKASLRLQDASVDLGTLTKKCVKGIGTGGGHMQAAGARVKDWEKFRRRFLAALGGHST